MLYQRPLGAFEFARYEGLGNDYLVVDAETFGTDLTPTLIRWICNRHEGVGSDGILLRLAPTDNVAHRLRIFNPDGSEAEKSGNGLRIFARFLWDFGFTQHHDFEIETLAGMITAKLHIRQDAPMRITLGMGQARFQSAAVHMEGPDTSTVRRTLQIGSQTLDATFVDLGNPHCVIFEMPLTDANLEALGPQIMAHPQFTQRINVQLVQIDSRRQIRILIWERGAGKTQASGSSSCAAASAAARRGLVDLGEVLTVCMPGGHLEVEIDANFNVLLHGPAQPICRGELLSHRSS